jgi:L-ascorbate metabolism protein UlaG (beta-lactamase superfamily)
MKLIGEHYPVDFAFLPIGGNYTMDTDDAIIASYMIKCDKIIGMHFNTWPIISIDMEVAKTKFKNAGKELILFKIGETKEIC